jgi:regulator of sirC expression with transglutaminase-like and TPR domain
MKRSLSTPAYCRPQAYAAFAFELGHIESTRGLFRSACAIAMHDRPHSDVQQTELVVERLVDTVRSRVHTPTSQARLAHLHDVLFDLVGLRGNVDDYYNPENSYLPDVLRTRRGLPISLVLIYKCVAEGIGLTVHGINAPGHFIAAVETEPPRPHAEGEHSWMYVDPFYGGSLLDEDEVFQRITDSTGRDMPRSRQLLARASGHQWLTRMLTNLQAAFAAAGRERDMLAMQELQGLLDVSIAPSKRRVQ